MSKVVLTPNSVGPGLRLGLVPGKFAVDTGHGLTLRNRPSNAGISVQMKFPEQELELHGSADIVLSVVNPTTVFLLQPIDVANVELTGRITVSSSNPSIGLRLGMFVYTTSPVSIAQLEVSYQSGASSMTNAVAKALVAPYFTGNPPYANCALNLGAANVLSSIKVSANVCTSDGNSLANTYGQVQIGIVASASSSSSNVTLRPVGTQGIAKFLRLNQ